MGAPCVDDMLDGPPSWDPSYVRNYPGSLSSGAAASGLMGKKASTKAWEANVPEMLKAKVLHKRSLSLMFLQQLLAARQVQSRAPDSLVQC